MSDLLLEPVDTWADEGAMAPGAEGYDEDPLFEAWPTAVDC